jgi:ATP synthase protein I
MPNPKPSSTLGPSDSAERMVRHVEARQAKMLRKRNQQGDFWRSLALLGLVGWSVAIPTLLGALAGAWIDHHWPSRFSWTLMLLVIGLTLGCLNAWLQVKRDDNE